MLMQVGLNVILAASGLVESRTDSLALGGFGIMVLLGFWSQKRRRRQAVNPEDLVHPPIGARTEPLILTGARATLVVLPFAVFVSLGMYEPVFGAAGGSMLGVLLAQSNAILRQLRYETTHDQRFTYVRRTGVRQAQLTLRDRSA